MEGESLLGYLWTGLSGRGGSQFLRYLAKGKWTLLLLLVNVAIFIFVPLTNNYVLFPRVLLFRWYPMVTSLFFHTSWVHLIANMIGLYLFGRIVEQRLGVGKMLFLYLGAGIFANLAHVFLHFNDNIGAIGSSGAVLGLVSTAVMLMPYHTISELGVPLPVMFFGWVGIGLDLIGLLDPQSLGLAAIPHLVGYASVYLFIEFFALPHEDLYQRGFFLNGITFLTSFGVAVLSVFL